MKQLKANTNTHEAKEIIKARNLLESESAQDRFDGICLLKGLGLKGDGRGFLQSMIFFNVNSSDCTVIIKQPNEKL